MILDQAVLEALIDEAKKRTFHANEQKAKQEKHEENLQRIKTPFTPHELQDFVLWRLRTEILKDQTPVFGEKAKDIFKALCFYFANDIEFETMGKNWKINKGICLMGNIGVGKTTLMRMFAKNKRQCFDVVSCRTVAADFAENGHDAFKIYSENKKNYSNDYRNFLQPINGYCFDDLGTEEVKKNYGNQVNVMEEIVLNRYDNSHTGWHLTHITTNLTADQIGEIYGNRVRDRMREMFNIIELTGESLRK